MWYLWAYLVVGAWLTAWSVFWAWRSMKSHPVGSLFRPERCPGWWSFFGACLLFVVLWPLAAPFGMGQWIATPPKPRRRGDVSW